MSRDEVILRGAAQVVESIENLTAELGGVRRALEELATPPRGACMHACMHACELAAPGGDPSVRLLCLLPSGHTGAHSDGEAHWTESNGESEIWVDRAAVVRNRGVC